MTNIPAKVILVVEDDKEIAEIMQILLQEKGYTVHCLAHIHPEQALSLRADLIIMDLWLDHHNGTELCRALKNDPRTKAIPVIICSALNSLPAIQEKCQADAVLEKPFGLETFINEVERLVG
jgi:CheY-like chemotaxis protein